MATAAIFTTIIPTIPTIIPEVVYFIGTTIYGLSKIRPLIVEVINRYLAL